MSPAPIPSPLADERVVLQLRPGVAVAVRIHARHVQPARETPLHTFLYSPPLWAATLAGIAVFALVSSAFATGALRPAPPPPAAPRAGEPMPTPDGRPILSIGGFVLQPPPQLATVPSPTQDAAPPSAETTASPTPAAQDQAPDDVAVEAPTPLPCRNLFGLGCGVLPPPPPKPVVPRQPLPLPGPSPVPGDDQAPPPDVSGINAGPPRGSNLDAALHMASVADQNFLREVSATPQAASGD